MRTSEDYLKLSRSEVSELTDRELAEGTFILLRDAGRALSDLSSHPLMGRLMQNSPMATLLGR